MSVTWERDRLQQVLDELPEAVYIIDESGTIVLANRMARDILGLNPAGQPAPTNMLEAYAAYGARRRDGSHSPSDETPLRRSFRHGAIVRGAQEIIRHAGTGRDIPVLINSAPLHDANGAIVGAVAVFQDISPLRNLERARDKFLASVSHELKTPLTTIRGLSQLLHRQIHRLGIPNSTKIIRELDALLAATEAMTGVVEHLLDVTRLETGRTLNLERVPTNLAELVQTAVSRQPVTARQRIVVQRAPDALVATVDAARLERVITTLLSNAVKYSPGGGMIQVRLTREEHGTEIWAVLDVQDQGIGIPAADLPHLFEPFYRARNAADQIIGTGVGLASARYTVEAHGGRLTVESQEGVGSTVTVRLPAGAHGDILSTQATVAS